MINNLMLNNLGANLVPTFEKQGLVLCMKLKLSRHVPVTKIILTIPSCINNFLNCKWRHRWTDERSRQNLRQV